MKALLRLVLAVPISLALAPAQTPPPPTFANLYGGVVSPLGTNGNSIQPTSDGGYIVTGWTEAVPPESISIWVLKLDSKGNTNWQKSFTVDGKLCMGGWASQTSDGGYVVAASCGSQETPDLILMLKLSSSGALQWEKRYGGNYGTEPTVVFQTSDGGYLVGGQTYDYDGLGSACLFRLDSNGNIVWQKYYRLSSSTANSPSGAFSVRPTPDGGFIVSGSQYAAWVLKLDANGDVTWQNEYDFNVAQGGQAAFLWVEPTSDGGYIAAGTYYLSLGVDNAFYEPILTKLDSSGNPVWEQGFWDGQAFPGAAAVAEASDGGYTVMGYAPIKGGPWILKVDQSGQTVLWQNMLLSGTNSEFNAMTKSADGGFAMTGNYSADGVQLTVVKVNSSGQVNLCRKETISPRLSTNSTPAVQVSSPDYVTADGTAPITSLTVKAIPTVAPVQNACLP